jgi:hypothetical protein
VFPDRSDGPVSSTYSRIHARSTRVSWALSFPVAGHTELYRGLVAQRTVRPHGPPVGHRQGPNQEE